MDLGKLTAIISAQIDEFERNMDRASGKLDTMGESGKRGGDKASAGMAVLSKAAGVAVVAVQAVAAAAVAAGTAFVALGAKGMKLADEQAKLARQIGTTQRQIAILTEAGGLAGISATELRTNMERLTRSLGDATTKGGPVADALERIGLNARDLAMMDTDEQMRAIAGALDTLRSRTEQASVAQELFGRSGQKMLVFFDDADANLDRATKRVDAFGLALSEVETDRIEAANDAMSSIQSVITGIANRIAAQFAPVLEHIALKFEEVALDTEGFKDVVDGVFDFVIKGAGFVADSIEAIRRVFASVRYAGVVMGNAVIKVFSEIILGISNLVDWGIGKINTLIEATNKLPFINIELIKPTAESDFIKRVNTMADTSEEKLKEAWEDIQNVWSNEWPSEWLNSFMSQLDKASSFAGSVKNPFTVPSVEDDDTGGGLVPEVDYDSELDKIREFLMDEQELLGKRFADRKALLDEALEKEKVTQEEHNELMKGLTEQYENDITDIEKKAQEERNQLMLSAGTMMANNLISIYSNLVDATEKEGKRNFQLQKAASIAQAVVDGISAGISSYKTGAAIGGPVVGAAFAATSAAATGAMIAKLASASYGGGSSASVPTPSATTPAVQSQQTLLVQGDFDSSQLFSGSAVRDLIDKIGEAQKDGYTVVMA